MPRKLTDLDWPVTTERLTIRPPADGDVAAMFAYRRLPGVAEWLTGLDDDEQAFATKVADLEWRGRTLLISHEGEVIGDLMIRVQDAWAQAEVSEQGVGVEAELGWVLAPDAAGRGLATEAVRELLRICFDDLGLRRVTAVCFAANEKSWRLMERVGMRRETASVADGLHRSGTWMDSYTYAILATEWHPTQVAERSQHVGFQPDDGADRPDALPPHAV